MQKDKRIFVHIGQHKTGSTSIQNALINNKTILNKNNIYFFRENPDGSDGMNSESWVEPIRPFNTNSWPKLQKPECYDDVYKIINPEILAKKLSNLPGDVIISSESLSLVNRDDKLSEFKSCLKKYFNKIIIIIYIRRQDAQIISHSQEEAKGGGSFNKFGFFFNNNTAIPKYSDYFNEYLDYSNRLSKWGDVFGDSNLLIKIFEKKLLLNEDVVQDFFKTIGVETILYSSRENESWGFEKSKVVFLMQTIKMNSYMMQIIEQNMDNSGKLLPSRNEAIGLYSIYKNNNEKLNKRFSINNNKYLFNDDFSMYPESKMDIWTEESANQAICNILEAVNNITPRRLFFISIKLRASFVRKKIRNIRLLINL